MAQGVLQAAQATGGDREAMDPVYLQIFLVKYLCSQPGCFGTLVPQALGSTVHACNVCCKARTEAEFIAELETELEAGA